MPRRQTAAALLVVLVAVLSAVAVPVAADTFVSVSVDPATDDPVAEESFPIDVAVSNAPDSDESYVVTELEVREGRNATSDEVETENSLSERVRPGERRTLTIEPTLNETGERTVYVHVTLLGDVESRHVVQPADVTVRDPAPDPKLQLAVSEAVAGAERTVNVTVANGHNASLRQLDVSVSTAADGVSFGAASRVRAVLGPQRTGTFSFPARVNDTGRHPVDVSVSYTHDGERETVSEAFTGDFTAPGNPGRVRLTGVSVTRTEGTLALSGSASNVGGDAVSSVVVSVLDGDRVSPAQPQPDYFVGRVESSDFVSFDLNARAEGNVSSVPVRVEYVVDGVERSHETRIPVGPAARATPEPTSQRGSLPTVPLAVGGVAVVALVAVAWRR